MGDRNNPIKFGPEWLRNLARERYAGGPAGTNQNAAAQGGGGTASGGATTSSSSQSITSTANTNASSKVQLAKLRYGREEMLALYDRTSQAPSELKFIDILYQPRGKQPLALSNSFEDDMRDTMRSSPLTGPMQPYAMFGPRGVGRGMNVSETRGRVRLPFLRNPVTGRGSFRHLGNPRMPGYSGGTEDDAPAALRSWNNSNGGNAGGKVGNSEQAEWSENKMYRSKRTGTNTNWRQSTRDDEEWRASDGNRSRQSGQQDKWERDWNDKAPQDRQSWSLNRRTWVGNETQNNDDNLPEWAVDGAEACAGTFDASGAFHGYSNDDSNLPKSLESNYALTRSHTHGSFVRSKTVEEGSEEWWASEKAKKLSPKRFDASEIKFKKSNSVIPELSSGTSSNSKSNEETSGYKGHDKPDTGSAGITPTEQQSDNNSGGSDDNFNKRSVRFAESKTFDALMRSDINLEEASDERGNFQSVMITPNNSLRQKHQNIVSSANNYSQVHPKLQYILSLQKSQPSQNIDSELSKQSSASDDKMVDLMELTLEDKEIAPKLLPPIESPAINTSIPAMSSTMSAGSNTASQMNSSAMHLRMSSPIHHTQGLSMTHKSSITTPGPQPSALPTPGIQNVGITSSALNASLGLPLGPPSNAMNQAMGLPLQSLPPPLLPNPGIANAGVGANVMQAGAQGIPGFQSSASLAGSNVVNSSLFLGQNSNAPPLKAPNDMPLNPGNQTNMFPIHGLQHTGSQAAFNSSIYSNMMQQSPASNPTNSQSLVDQWFYEDPKGEIQGPFSSKEMYNWYQAGFFSPSLMVRRACDVHMRPLGSYGPVIPFQPMDMLSPYPMSSGFDSRNQGPHESMLSSQQGMGIDVMNMAETNSVDTLQFGTVGLINRNQPFGQQPMVDSLWSQPSPSPDMLWVQQALSARNENRVNNLSMMFWDQQPSAITSNSLLPEEIAKEMKTEDQILAQLRASQNINPPQKLSFINEPPPVLTPPVSKPEDVFPPPPPTATPNLEGLQKLIQEDPMKDDKDPALKTTSKNLDTDEQQMKLENLSISEQSSIELNNGKTQTIQGKPVVDSKAPKQTKGENEKTAKNKENSAKSKVSKKTKEDKKEESELKTKEEEVSKAEKRLEESSPSKHKKDLNKKELEKEKKEWIKEGFTIVKTEKSNKDTKKKLEETKAAEEAERKSANELFRREEERLVLEEEKKRKQAEAMKKQQDIQQQPQQRQAAELVMKKAPWSAVSSQSVQATSKEGPTLAEIQRLEREKKLEQMKEQQQMMQIIAHQQAAALAREQEMQAGLGWAKKKGNLNTPGQSLAEIQAEARKQAAASAAAAAAAATAVTSQTLEEMPAATQPQMNHVPWGNPHNGGGFWDTPPNQALKPQEVSKAADPAKQKKKPSVQPMKKEMTPAAEFELWCTTVLTSWSAKIDVPTFVGFLKDIESPYEVKDYVKCYLGDSKDSNDFSRQFLERRSKLLRVGMVTPSDDLCSPAIAVNPRTTSGSDYQEVKGKTKKTKKSKMLKVDNRILGFSVTAAEDRINVGDIDTV